MVKCFRRVAGPVLTSPRSGLLSLNAGYLARRDCIAQAGLGLTSVMQGEAWAVSPSAIKTSLTSGASRRITEYGHVTMHRASLDANGSMWGKRQGSSGGSRESREASEVPYSELLPLFKKRQLAHAQDEEQRRGSGHESGEDACTGSSAPIRCCAARAELAYTAALLQYDVGLRRTHDIC